MQPSQILFQGVETQTSILNATVNQREKFISLIDREPKLDYVEIPHWAGLGGICYLPPELSKTEDEQPAKEVQRIKIQKILNLLRKLLFCNFFFLVDMYRCSSNSY
jgi:hypothetical protein